MRKHTPLLIMAATSTAFFFSNVIAKKHFSINEYLEYSYFITVTSILSSFSLLGTEQLIIRTSKTNNNKIQIPSSTVITICFALAISLILAGPALTLILKKTINSHDSTAACLAFATTLIYYNTTRINQQFNKSQIINGNWRILTLIATIITTLSTVKNFDPKLIYYPTILINLIAISQQAKNVTIQINTNYKGTAISAIGFSLSLAIMTLLGNIDKIVAERSESQFLFTTYIYFSMITITPFNMIISYIGFKEAIHFKNKFSMHILHNKIATTSFFITSIYILYTIALFTLQEVFDYKFHIETILLTYILITIKSVYSLLSSTMGSRGSAKNIWWSNLISTLIIGAAILLHTHFININTINDILILSIFLWTIRSAAYYVFIPKNESY